MYVEPVDIMCVILTQPCSVVRYQQGIDDPFCMALVSWQTSSRRTFCMHDQMAAFEASNTLEHSDLWHKCQMGTYYLDGNLHP
jgi:hypothetical protein